MCRRLLKHSLSSFSLLLINFIALVEGNAFIYADCSPNKFEPNTAFQANLISLLSSITASSNHVSYNSFTPANNDTTGAAIYGLYQCRNDLRVSDCGACVVSAASQLNLVCAYAISAILQLDGCIIRYGNEDFLGRLEITLLHKRCSSRTTADGEFFRRRDDVLGDLENGEGFRVSSSGSVEGFGQCLGDLSSGDCSVCLAAAVSQLKNACGSALAADVFLGQCYARYWASGYYPNSSPDSSDDDVGRTVAIIVGVLAGVALFVVFLSFLRRACQPKHL